MSFLEARRNCLMVTPGDIPAITGAIQEIYENPELRKSLGREARKTAEMLSIDKYVEKLSLIYQEIAGIAMPQKSGVPEGTHDLAD